MILVVLSDVDDHLFSWAGLEHVVAPIGQSGAANTKNPQHVLKLANCRHQDARFSSEYPPSDHAAPHRYKSHDDAQRDVQERYKHFAILEAAEDFIFKG